MNKQAFLILVCGLSVLALVGTMSVGSLTKVTAVDLTNPDDFKDEDVIAAPIAQASEKRLMSASVNLDEIWEKSLFNPERRELAEEANSDSAAEQQMNADFELAGIALLGVPGVAEPVAIIRAKQKTDDKANRRTANSRQNRGQQRSSANNNNNNNKKQTTEKKENVKTVFRKGDVIANTGYTLTAIYPEEKMVELSRGRDTIKLVIEYKSEISAERRKTVATQESEKRKERIAQEEKAKTEVKKQEAAAARQEKVASRSSQKQDSEAKDNSDAVTNNAAEVGKNGETASPVTNNPDMPPAPPSTPSRRRNQSQ